MSEPLSESELAELECLDAAGSRAPWTVGEPGLAAGVAELGIHGGTISADMTIIERQPQSRAESMTIFAEYILSGYVSPEDARLIAAARNALPRLLRENDRLRAAMRSALGAIEAGELTHEQSCGEAAALLRAALGEAGEP